VQDDTAGREAYHPPVPGVVRTIVGAIRVVHPAPTAAVVTLSAALAAILAAQNAADGLGPRTWLVTLSVLGSQVLTGATNDWADRRRDAVVQHDKPIPSGEIPARGAIVVAVAGLALQVAASVPLGPLALGLGLVASASAAAYNLGLSATPASVIPYLVSFGVLPFWIASGVDVPIDRVAAAPLLVAPFAAAAHLANTARDFDADRSIGRRNLAQVLGRGRAIAAAWALALGAGLVPGALALAAGRIGALDGALGAAGLIAVAQGFGSARRLWVGMLVAAVCWTAAWALGTG
jgi:4-hydroxybenzoate polyprenyltransferase